MSAGRLIIEQEAAALAQLAQDFPAMFPQAIQDLRNIVGKIICSGIGKSGHVARKVASTLSSIGTPAFFLHPTEALHGDLGAVSPQDVLLLFSRSGETPELLRFAHHSTAHKRIVITAYPQSSLAFCCDIVLTIPQLKEACHLDLAPTTSTIMMLALGDALALTLSARKNFQTEQYHRLHPEGTLGQRLLSVDHIMKTPAPVLPQNASIQEILFLMIKHPANCVGLKDEQNQVVQLIIPEHIEQILHQRSIPKLAPHFVPPSMRISEAMNLMDEHKIPVLFVQEDSQRVLGVFSYADGLKVEKRHV